ncbi:MAG TPA: hypothetical protein VLJ37_07370 [bacterium]|nr:hypothetical protein [bacterium]
MPAHLESLPLSERYCDLLNRELVDENTPFSVAPAPNSSEGSNPSVTVIFASKIVRDRFVRELSLIQGPLLQARKSVEHRRLRVVEAATRQMTISRSTTLEHLNEATPAERLWLQLAAEPLARIANDLYAAQASPWSDQIDGWMARYADAASLWHYHRIRTPKLPGLLPAFVPEDIPDYALYASSVAFFPREPAYHAMLPVDFTEDELAYLVQDFPQDHPIRLPYTVVERMDESECDPDRREGVWIVRGREGRAYRVTHMRFHPRYAAYFEQFAEILERNADLSAGGQGLDPGFRDYTLRMARSLRTGDFLDILRADLEQSSGNVFFTFFPHEGSWADNLKFPWSFEAGIRSRSLAETIRCRGDAFAMLEERARRIAESYGAPVPNRPAETGDVEKMFQLVWNYRNGGFLRTYPHGEPAGHDYPKIFFAGVGGHRSIAIADAMVAAAGLDQKYAAELLPPKDALPDTTETSFLFTTWHEGSHGVLGNKPDTELVDGRTLGQVYGRLWGRLVEPQSDAAFAVVNSWLRDAGRITNEEFDLMLRYAFLAIVKRMAPKDRIWEPAYDFGHEAGCTMTFGWLSRNGVVQLEDDGRFQVRWPRMAGALEDLWIKLTEFAFNGSTEPFREFVERCLDAIPQSVMNRVLEAQRQFRVRRILTRGDVPSPIEFP